MTLQVRARNQIKKGALVLVPAFGDTWPVPDKDSHPLAPIPKGALHESMLQCVNVSSILFKVRMWEPILWEPTLWEATLWEATL